MKTLFFLSLVFLVACKKEKSDLDQVANIRAGSCILTRNGSSYICIDFTISDSNAATTACDTENSRYPSSGGVNGQGYLSGSSNTCDTQTSATKVGKCTRSDGVINYYSSHFTEASSQTDCTTIHSGTWAAP